VVRGGVRGGVKKRGLFVGGRKWTRTLGIGGAQKSGFREMTKKRVFLGGGGVRRGQEIGNFRKKRVFSPSERVWRGLQGGTPQGAVHILHLLSALSSQMPGHGLGVIFQCAVLLPTGS